MKIVVSNDDGIHSPGIQALAKSLEGLGEIWIVAPNRERSTAGHSLTLHKPVRVEEVAPRQFSVSGTPADCIYLALAEILDSPPDMIVSGTNSGANLGTDVHYSGTVAAAREGALVNIPSYAFSIVDLHQTVAGHPEEDLRFDVAAKMARKVIDTVQGIGFPPHSLINVNIPNLPEDKIKGLRIARQGIRFYANRAEKRIDPRGRPYYWVGGGYTGFEESRVSDCHAVNEGYVAVTPMTIDGTHNEFYTTLEGTGKF